MREKMVEKMKETKIKVEWCFCGRCLQDGLCPVHKTFTAKPEVRSRIGRWSGRSKNREYGLNWGVDWGPRP